MRVAFEDNRLLISSHLVGSDTTVVTFAAFGREPDPVPKSEYHRELLGWNDELGPSGSVNIITVVDKQRRYYLDGAVEIIVARVNEILVESNTKVTLTIGLSMGGFAAIVFAKRLHCCRKAIAFGARSAVHPAVLPSDQRALGARQAIQNWDVLDGLRELDKTIRYDLIYGSSEAEDVAHAKRFRRVRRRNLRVKIIEGAGHNVLYYWAKRGTLDENLYDLIYRPEELTIWRRLWNYVVAAIRRRQGAGRGRSSGPQDDARGIGEAQAS